MSLSTRTPWTSGRVLAVVIGIPLALAAAGQGAFNLIGLYAHTSEHHAVSFPLGSGAISLTTGDGSVTVVVGQNDVVGVSYTEHYELKRPTVSSTTTGGGVQLVAKCPGGLLDNNCAVNYVLTVPASASMTLHTGDGTVHITGTTGVLAVDTGDGSVHLDGVSGAVTAKSGDGSIDASALRSTSVQATTGDGDVSLEWAVMPTQVDATSGDGGIHLQLPKGSGPYRVSSTTGDGSSHVTVPSDSTAKASIAAHTGDGSITIGYAGS
jgi:hypothetical protein